MKMKEVCPKCFAQTGCSIVLEEEKGLYFCPKNAQHRFKKNKEGFLEIHTISP